MSKPDMADDVYPEYKHLRSRMALCHEIKRFRDAQQVAVDAQALTNSEFTAYQHGKNDSETVLVHTIDTLATRLAQALAERNYAQRELARIKRKHPGS